MILHQTLEYGQGITQPICHLQELIHSHVTHYKGGVLLGLLRHFHLPKAIFSFRSMHEKCPTPIMDSIVSCIWGKGYASFFVWVFSLWKSMQNQRPPSFFLTNTATLHHGNCDSFMVPPPNISCKCSSTSSTKVGAVLQNLSLKGLSSVNSITCFTVLVHLISFGSGENTWWNSSNNHFALRT